MRSKICLLIEIILAIFFTGFIALNTFWYFEEDTYSSLTPEHELQVIKAGDYIRVSRSVCSDKLLEITAQGFFVNVKDGSTEKHPTPKRGYVNDGYCESITLDIKTPVTLSAGNYEYRTQLIYDLNPLKRAVRDLTPIKIKVVEEWQR